jgi:hypothetical protein
MQKLRWLTVSLLAPVTFWGCGETQAPNLDGSPFMAATVDGTRWVPGADPSALYALLGAQRVILVARRPTQQPAGEEILQVEFATTEIFRERSYRLAADISGFATFQVFTQSPGGSVAFYTTTPDHAGTLTIQGASAQDSVVTGFFAFDAVSLSGSSAVHHFTGQFRVRYTTTVP